MKEMILIGIDVDAVKQVLEKLEPQKQNKALQKALKATAEQARMRLAEKAQSSYTVTNAGFKKAMRIRATSGGTPAATIRSEGAPLPLRSFKVRNGRTVKAQVLKEGGLKPIVSQKSGAKAFINNIAAKGQVRKKNTAKGKKGSSVRHSAVAQRQGKERLGINEKYSNSIPVMIGSQKHAYGLIEPYISTDLQDNLRKFVDQALGG